MSAAWIVITASDLNDYSVAAKVSALRTAALAGGQTDPFDRVMPDVVATMRAQIGLNNEVSATANSLPPEVKTHGCWLVIAALQARLPGLKLTDEEKEMVKEARRYMEKIAAGDIRVTEPTNPVDSGLQTGTPSIAANDREVDRTTMDGM
jgi:hypothetical protein